MESPTVCINEIQFAPVSGRPEWVELWNTGTETLDLRGWVLHDAGTARPAIADSSCILEAGAYLVITGDDRLGDILPPGIRFRVMSRFPSLNNTGDDITLRRPDGSEAERVPYAADWGGGGGVSLERLDARADAWRRENWLPSADPTGATPGRRNSIALPAAGALPAQGAPVLRCAPNPFSPDGDGYEDRCALSWRLTQPGAQLRLRVFDATGCLRRTILGNASSSREGSVEWDGRDDGGTALPPGLYPLLLEASDAAGTVCTAKTVIVVARRL